MNVVMIVINNFTNDARVDRAASALAQGGYSVTVLALKDENTPREETINGYRVERIKVGLRGLPKKSIFQLVKYMEFIIKVYRRAAALKPRIIHAHDLNALPPAYRAAKKTGAKLIYDSHELALERNAVQRRPAWEKRAWEKIEEYIIKKCDGVITVSPGIARELARRYNIEEPHVIMNCPAYKKISRRNLIREKLGLAREDIIILYQGIIAPNRGLEELIAACGHLPPRYKVAILGTDSGHRRTLEEMAGKLGLRARVFFLGPVPVEQVLDYVASADLGTCLVNPEVLSHKLTLPNKLFECMAAGIPLITSEPYGELVENAGCGRACSSRDPGAIASAIEDIMSDREGYEKMSLNAIRAAKSTFNWQNESQKLLQLYAKISESAASP